MTSGFSTLALLALLLTAVNAVPRSSSCATSDSASALDPCCNTKTAPNGFDISLVRYTTILTGCKVQPCFSCGVDSASDTADSAEHQEIADMVYCFYETNNCFNGYTARAPGSSVEFKNKTTWMNENSQYIVCTVPSVCILKQSDSVALTSSWVLILTAIVFSALSV